MVDVIAVCPVQRGAGVLDEKSARRWSSVPFPLPLHCSLQRAQACFAGRRVMSFGSGVRIALTGGGGGGGGGGGVCVIVCVAYLLSAF